MTHRAEPSRVLMVSPHFPPDGSAGAHRVRLLAPHLERYGWEPTVASVQPRYYETRLDPDLAALVPETLRVVRCRAWPVSWARRIGVGDLGLRALKGLYRTCIDLLDRERFDCLFVTIYPTYPALLGPVLKRRYEIPFVLDYQDPWVGSWGLTVGGGRNGSPDVRSRLSRALASRLEPLVTRAADAITAVSSETYVQVQSRYPHLRNTLCKAIPLGGEPLDFERLRAKPKRNRHFDPSDGHFHLCYVGTLLPLGFGTLRAVFRACRLLQERRPDLYARLKLHFVGTSNQTASTAALRALPVAREFDVQDRVTETAARVDYLDALTALTQASAILMLGSSERHYTASKLYPALLAERPILAVYHAASPVVRILQESLRPPTGRIVSYDDQHPAEYYSNAIYSELSGLVENPIYNPSDLNRDSVERFSAVSLAGELAMVLKQVSNRPCRRSTRSG